MPDRFLIPVNVFREEGKAAADKRATGNEAEKTKTPGFVR